ncbi:RHS repeat-associated core domain-containing protein, partial [Burkholderia multivorans]|uniref:glycohydrolase toxin TNT-related protein n=2 Tax=Burkholderia multivorans TaxID=87883 RepID=UPI00209CC7C7
GEAREVIARASKAAGIVARNSLRFQGQQEDEETGLHYNRHRYYDAQTGRFVSKDPIGLAGGTNVYHYAPNPINWTDPLGLARCVSNPATVAQDASGRWRDAQGRFAKNPGWPSNYGFAADQDSMVTLPSGTRIDRFGRPSGGFVAPVGTPFGQRALPESSYNSEYHVYEVAKPIEGVRAGPAEPWFRQPGGGTQYQLPRSVEAHLKDGELVEVTGHCGKPKK